MIRSVTPLLAERHHLRGRVGDGEQRRRGLVDAGVGRLRRQHHRDQQREGIDVFELALRLRLGGGETLENRLGPGRFACRDSFLAMRRIVASTLARAKRGFGGALPPRGCAKQYVPWG